MHTLALSTHSSSRYRSHDHPILGLPANTDGRISFSVKELIRDIDPDAYTKPKLSATKAERKTAKAARREEVNRRKAVQEETSLIAMRVFEKLLETTDEDSQSKQVATDVSTGSDLYRELLANSMAHARRFSQSRSGFGS